MGDPNVWYRIPPTPRVIIPAVAAAIGAGGLFYHLVRNKKIFGGEWRLFCKAGEYVIFRFVTSGALEDMLPHVRAGYNAPGCSVLLHDTGNAGSPGVGRSGVLKSAPLYVQRT
jgi:hypothetical protein